ncbi:MAG: HD domain-containing protein [Rhodoferax sp.]
MTQDLVTRASAFATQAHRHIDHRRKYSKQPYEVHLKGVVHEVGSVTDDPEVCAAAWLHDLVEDTEVTLGDIRREFGERVAALVSDLTDVSRPGDGNRVARKAIDRRHLQAATPAAKTIKLADLMDNCRDICRHDPRFGRTYLREMAGLLGVLGEGDPHLYRRAWALWTREAAKLGVALAEHSADPETSAESSVNPAFLTGADGPRTARRFAEVFSAGDIAEPVLSFDASMTQHAIRASMMEQGVAAALLREQGRPAGLVLLEDLSESSGPARLRPIRAGQVVAADAPLPDVIEVLNRQDVCLVEAFGEPGGIIGRGDMQKPQVRMWLFGIVTLIEMALTRRIAQLFPHEQWRPLLSSGRLQKALALRDERGRLGQPCALIDCLQLGDKSVILLNDPDFPVRFSFASRSAAKQGMNELQSLRNNLAHTQDIVASDWAQIARIARGLARMSAPQ